MFTRASASDDAPENRAATAPGHGGPHPDGGGTGDVERMSKLLDRVPAIIYIADPGASGRWHYVSAQIQAILGFSTTEWYADPELWARRLHPDDRDRVLEGEASEVAGNTAPNATEYRMLHASGHIVWIRDEAMLVVDSDGCQRWHGVLSDITDRKQAELALERQAAQQAAVAQLGEHALEGSSPEELMNEAVTRAVEILGVERAGVSQLVPEENCFVMRVACPPAEECRFPIGNESQAGYTVITGAPVVVDDWCNEQRFALTPRLRELGIQSGLSVLIEGSRGPFGVLAVHSAELRHFGTGEIDFLQSLANVLADAIERQTVEDDVRHRALHDGLTGLPNRVLFLDRLELALARLQRHRSMAAILCLDLDHFNVLNDSLGHHFGDELLADVAPRLRHVLRACDTVARFGGDEFVILLEDIGSERDAVRMVERIAGAFIEPFVLDGDEHFITTSIGVALAEGGEEAEELIRDADAALYRAKQRGRARYEMFDEVLRGQAMARLRVENDLRRALERGELRLHYQPVVRMADESIVGVEALVRWDHPERGLVPPSEFIPVAEENGLIEPIGEWVLDEACRQAARWHRAHPDEPPLGMSVNLSAVQVVGRDLRGVVAAALLGSGLDPASLSLEITETAMLTDTEGLSDALRSLKDTGVQLVLDDFGTGYSSLGYLTHLPIDTLKVDRSFVDGLGTERNDTAITEAIIAMSRALSLEVIAEGVETVLQVDELSRLGCELAQGFHYSRPVPAHEVSTMLRNHPRGSLAGTARRQRGDHG